MSDNPFPADLYKAFLIEHGFISRITRYPRDLVNSVIDLAAAFRDYQNSGTEKTFHEHIGYNPLDTWFGKHEIGFFHAKGFNTNGKTVDGLAEQGYEILPNTDGDKPMIEIQSISLTFTASRKTIASLTDFLRPHIVITHASVNGYKLNLAPLNGDARITLEMAERVVFPDAIAQKICPYRMYVE